MNNSENQAEVKPLEVAGLDGCKNRFNNIRTLAARLSYFNAVSGGILSCIPLTLKLRLVMLTAT